MEERETETCEICGEGIKTDRNGFYREEVGEFWDPEKQTSVIAHAQCGFDADLQPA